MLKDSHTGGFQPYTGLTSLQQAPCWSPSPCSIPRLQTVALKALHQTGADEEHESCSSRQHSQSLSDGRLNVGTHLPLMAKRYAYLSLIGEGTSAQVVLAEDTWQPSRQLVAIKVMKRQHSYTGQKEVRALRYLHARGPASMSVVKLLGTFTHAGHLCLVLEQLYGSLLDYVSHSSTLAPAVQLTNLRQIAFQLMGTVAVLHAHGVVHADLKPENILLKEPIQEDTACPEVVVTDFGNPFSVSETDTAKVAFEVQTLPYRAPEVVAGCGLTDGAALDAWSLGCILAELALKRPLFPCNSPSELLAQMGYMLRRPSKAPRPSATPLQWDTIGHGQQDDELIAKLADSAMPKQNISSWQANLSRLGSELVKVDIALCDLILKLLCWEPVKRLSAMDALLHPFFDDLSPLRHLLQVIPCGESAAPSHEQPKPLELQSLMQHARAAARRAPSVKDSKASPAPSCPTPISQRPDGQKEFKESTKALQMLRGGKQPKQAISAPLLLAQAAEVDSPASVANAQFTLEMQTNSALGSTGVVAVSAETDQSMQHESSANAETASAKAAAQPTGVASLHEAQSGSQATFSAAGDGTVHAEPAVEVSHNTGRAASEAILSAAQNGPLGGHPNGIINHNVGRPASQATLSAADKMALQGQPTAEVSQRKGPAGSVTMLSAADTRALHHLSVPFLHNLEQAHGGSKQPPEATSGHPANSVHSQSGSLANRASDTDLHPPTVPALHSLEEAVGASRGSSQAPKQASKQPASGVHSQSGSHATCPTGDKMAFHTELRPPSAPSLHSLEHARVASGLDTASKQPPNSAHSPSTRSRAARSQQQGYAQALFPEIQSRLPPVNFAMAGYTDVYDFSEGALAVADSFLRDAPSPEQASRPAMPAAHWNRVQALQFADTKASSAALGRLRTDPSPGRSMAGAEERTAGQLTSGAAAAETGAAAENSAPERSHGQSAAAARPTAVPQDTEQRSGRSSVTPHKAGTRDTHGEETSFRQQQPEGDQGVVQNRSSHVRAESGTAGAANAELADPGADSDTSQAAHETQAGVPIPVNTPDATVTVQQGGTSGDFHFGRSRGGSSVQRDQTERSNHYRQQQPGRSKPASGLDMLAAAAASTVNTLPDIGIARKEVKPNTRTPGDAPPLSKKGKRPTQAGPDGATSSRKRIFPRAADASGTPGKKQRSSGTALPVTASRKTQSNSRAGKSKTPGRTKGRPRKSSVAAASPVRSGVKRKQQSKDASPDPDGSYAFPDVSQETSGDDVSQETCGDEGASDRNIHSRDDKVPKKAARKRGASPVRKGVKGTQEAGNALPEPHSSYLPDDSEGVSDNPSTADERMTGEVHKMHIRTGKRAAPAKDGSPHELRNRARVAAKGAKPWWVV